MIIRQFGDTWEDFGS